jgi:hypothetical protein
MLHSLRWHRLGVILLISFSLCSVRGTILVEQLDVIISEKLSPAQKNSKMFGGGQLENVLKKVLLVPAPV